MQWIKNSAALILMWFLLTLGAGQAFSRVHGSGQLLKSAAEHNVFQAVSSLSSCRSFMEASFKSVCLELREQCFWNVGQFLPCFHMRVDVS